VSVAVAEIHGQPSDPYRIFFPLGMLLGIAGVSIWPLYHWGATSGYSGRSHAFIQSDCFLYSFIAGFLWTAIPRFTGTRTPPRLLQYVVAILILCQAVAFELQVFAVGHLLFVLVHCIVIGFAANCFIHQRHPPPETFVLVGIGMLSGLFAALLNAGVALQWVSPDWDASGKRLMTEGMVLLLVLGVGGFLGPRLLGFAQIPQLQDIGKLSVVAGLPIPVRTRQLLYAAAGIALVAAVIVEYKSNLAFVVWIRAVLVTIIVSVNLKPWLLPATRSTLSWAVWIAHWFVIAGVWAIAIVPRFRADFLHVLFIGGFTVLMLAVGTRVVLSHGGHSLNEERRSWPLRIGITTVIVAMFARIAAPFVPNSYFSHLAWGAILWITGVMVWGVFISSRILGIRNER